MAHFYPLDREKTLKYYVKLFHELFVIPCQYKKAICTYYNPQQDLP